MRNIPARFRQPAFGWGLEGVLQGRAADLSGILNGVDYEEWDPATDKFIAATYSSTDGEEGENGLQARSPEGHGSAAA